MEIVDLRDRLPTGRRTEGARDLARVDLLVVHWNGTPANLDQDDLALWEQDARYHIGHDWGGGVRGGGIMYNYGVGREGQVYYLRDETVATYHAYALNERALAVNCPLGEGQHPTPAQVQGVLALAAHLLQERPDLPGLRERSQVIGHGEGVAHGGLPTACPGPDLLAALASWRAGEPDTPPAEAGAGPLWFEETGHALGGGFLAFWRACGGLALFGYPLTDELTENGRTVQYFERARFEYHPDEPETVQLGRIGAELLEARGGHAS